MTSLWPALGFQLGYNANLVILGTTLLGFCAGMIGVFLYLRKRALVSDAIAHASLPGLAIAFLILSALGLDGRSLPILSVGAALSAAFGLVCIHFITARTKLDEDTAIGAVLSVFFGFGVVLLTAIQTLPFGQKAGLENFLLGASASMLWVDALTILIGSVATLAVIIWFRRPLITSIFDPIYAQSVGMHQARMDMLILGLALAITVIGLKIVGLILIVALLIIPAATARFWTDRISVLLIMAGLSGAFAGYFGAGVSASLPNVPTGPIIVLCSFVLFVLSFFIAPNRGVLVQIIKHLRLQHAVHRSQGLLALAQNQPIYEQKTFRLLQRAGLLLPDGQLTEKGQREAARLVWDQARWRTARQDPDLRSLADYEDGVTAIEKIFTPDQLQRLDQKIKSQAKVAL